MLSAPSSCEIAGTILGPCAPRFQQRCLEYRTAANFSIMLPALTLGELCDNVSSRYVTANHTSHRASAIKTQWPIFANHVRNMRDTVRAVLELIPIHGDPIIQSLSVTNLPVSPSGQIVSRIACKAYS